jgi:mannose-6-phosphate isomerase-like protein (cupin superfamily)
MNTIKSFLDSGILEMYVLGMASPEEVIQVQEMVVLHEEVRKEIDDISKVLKGYAETHAATPNNTIKAMILASVDYEERLKKGEQPSSPPILTDYSEIKDYDEWLTRKDMVLPADFNEIHARIIGYTPQAISAIVWIKSETSYEVHDNEYEKFLILEGTCDIDIDGDIHQLIPGDCLTIPLHKGHTVKVTSQTPCKVILQRVAA